MRFVRNAAMDSGDELRGLCAFVEAWLEKVALARFRDTAALQGVSLSAYFEDAEPYLEGPEGFGNPFSGLGDMVGDAFAGLARPFSGRDEVVLGGQDEWWRSWPRPLRQVLAAAVIFAGLWAVRAAMTSSGSGASSSVPSASRPQRPALSVPSLPRPAFPLAKPPPPPPPPTPPPLTDVTEISIAEAERVVRSWQAAKAAALGPARDVNGLKKALAGDVLSEWTLRATRAKQNGLMWRYGLKSAEVVALRSRPVPVAKPAGGKPARPGGMAVTVEVVLSERAELVDAKTSEIKDSYDDTYRVRYNLDRAPAINAPWLISSVAIVPRVLP